MSGDRPDFIELVYEFPAHLRPPDSEDYFKSPLLIAREMGLVPAAYSMKTPLTPKSHEVFDGLLIRRFDNPIKLYLAAARARPKLAHGHSYGWAASALGPTFLARYVFTAHVYRLDAYSRILVNAVARSIARSTAVVSLTHWEKVMLSQYVDPGKIHVIPCGVDVQYFSTPDPEGVARVRNRFGTSRLILCVSNIVKRKNLGTLIRAFKIVKEKVGTAKLLIAGTTPSMNLGVWRPTPTRETILDQLKEQVSLLGLGEDVIFLGHQQMDELRPLYQAADLFVTASEVEGQLLAAGEAASAGLPLALSNLEPLMEIYEGCALFHPPRDVNAVAASMLRILNDPDLARRLRSIGPARMRAYDLPVVRAKLRALYESCLSG